MFAKCKAYLKKIDHWFGEEADEAANLVQEELTAAENTVAELRADLLTVTRTATALASRVAALEAKATN